MTCIIDNRIPISAKTKVMILKIRPLIAGLTDSNEYARIYPEICHAKASTELDMFPSHWSSTEDNSVSNKAYFINFSNGYNGSLLKTSVLNTRCIRDF